MKNNLFLQILADVFMCLVALSICAWPIAGYFFDGYTVTFTVVSTLITIPVVILFTMPVWLTRYRFWKNWKKQ